MRVLLAGIAAIAVAAGVAGQAAATAIYEDINIDPATLTLNTDAHGDLISISGSFTLPTAGTLYKNQDDVVAFLSLSTPLDFSGYPNSSTLSFGQNNTSSITVFPGAHVLNQTTVYETTTTAIVSLIDVWSYRDQVPNAPSYTVDAGLKDFTVDVVPEPATWAMMLIGVGCMGAAMRSQRRVPVAA